MIKGALVCRFFVRKNKSFFNVQINSFFPYCVAFEEIKSMFLFKMGRKPENTEVTYYKTFSRQNKLVCLLQRLHNSLFAFKAGACMSGAHALLANIEIGRFSLQLKRTSLRTNIG
jgi:hypothetical protein